MITLMDVAKIRYENLAYAYASELKGVYLEPQPEPEHNYTDAQIEEAMEVYRQGLTTVDNMTRVEDEDDQGYGEDDCTCDLCRPDLHDLEPY